jgi:hypothetical protein
MADETHKKMEKKMEEKPQEEVMPAGDEEGTMEESKLPFPRATVTNMMRQYLDEGKQIKGAVKDEMNIWLGKMVERIANKMNAHPYSYVDYQMFKEAVEPYEKIQDVELEKEHIIKQLEAVKSQCDVLIREVDRKFTL